MFVFYIVFLFFFYVEINDSHATWKLTEKVNLSI